MINNKKKWLIPEIWNLICSYDNNIPNYDEIKDICIGDIKWVMRVKNINLGFVDYNYNSKKYDLEEKSKILGKLILIAKGKKVYLVLDYNGINILTGNKITEKGIFICFFNYDDSGFTNKSIYVYDIDFEKNKYIEKWLSTDIKKFQYIGCGEKLNIHNIININYNFKTINGNIYCNCIYDHKISLNNLIDIKPENY